jgi:hypothetical protein
MEPDLHKRVLRFRVFMSHASLFFIDLVDEHRLVGVGAPMAPEEESTSLGRNAC